MIPAVLLLVACLLAPIQPARKHSQIVSVHPVRVTTPVRQDTLSVSPRTSRGYARTRLPVKEFRCLDKLWTRESHWNHKARNKQSGAYGIPQALPAEKMKSAGNDWKTNPETQIRWGLTYIKKRYQTPCRALRHSQRKGWY